MTEKNVNRTRKKVTMKKKANRVDSKQISFRVSEQEYEKIKYMAEQKNISVAAYSKAKVQGIRLKQPLVDKEGAVLIARELRRIGVNVNQIAKVLNSGENANMSEIEGLQEELTKVWQQFKYLQQR